MDSKRTVSFDYNFSCNVENFSYLYHNDIKSFYPMEGKIHTSNPIFEPAYNPSFDIHCAIDKQFSVSEAKRVTDCFLSVRGIGKIPEDFCVQFEIIIKSTSNQLVKVTDKHVINSVTWKVKLFTAIIKGNTLRVNDQVIPYSHDHDFIAIKCHFKISYIDPVIPKVAPTPKVVREKRCSLCSDFKNFYVSKELADVAFTLGDDSLHAHKLVLTVRSPVFKAMFSNDCLESNTKTIQIADIDASVFEYFLKYIYYCEIGDISYKVVRNLYALADKYAVDDLKEECRDILEASLKGDTVCHILEMSQLFSDKALKERAVEFIKKHFTEVSRKPEWAKICKDYPDLASEVLRMVTLFLDKSKSV